jgi:hypothetical protein
LPELLDEAIVTQALPGEVGARLHLVSRDSIPSYCAQGTSQV